MKHLQKARMASRILFLTLLFIVPVLSWYLSHIPMGGVRAILHEPKPNIQHHIISSVDRLMHTGILTKAGSEGSSAENQQISNNIAYIGGDVWSGRIGDIQWLDILAWAELTVLSKTFLLPLISGGLLAIIVTILLGRIFCSWICPAGFIFDLGDKVRGIIKKNNNIRDLAFKRHHKYVLLIMGLIISSAVGLPILGYFYPPALLAREAHTATYAFLDNHHVTAWFGFTLTLGGAALFIFTLLIFEVFVSRRFWCRYMCAGGALYSLLGRFRLFRVTRKEALCTDCGECNKACPMGLHPMSDKFGIECDNCFACQDSCKDNALPITFGIRDKPLK